MKKLFLYIWISVFSFAFFSCEDNNEKDSIELDSNSTTIAINPEIEVVKLSSNGEWRITDIPEWLTIHPTFGNLSSEITILATENKELERRSASLVFTRGKTSKTLYLSQLGLSDLDPFIKLDEENITVNVEGGIKTIKLTTNTSCKITNIPYWMTMGDVSGNKSGEITVNVQENEEFDSRQVYLEITSEDEKIKKKLSILQYAQKDYIRLPYLPIFPTLSIKSSGGINYEIKTNRLFINPSIKNKIYLGNLISHNAGEITAIPEFTGYTFNPITISTSAPIREVVQVSIPSLKEQNDFAKRIIANKPKQIESLVADNGTVEFFTHKQLHAIGIATMGVKLDEVVSGASFKEYEMSKKQGLIFSFKQTLFSLAMDIPDKLIEEDLKNTDKSKGVSYVSWISYGKIGLLIVESDNNSRLIKAPINKVLGNESLTTAETQLIESADIYHVYYNNNNEVQVKRGTLDAINSYKNALTNTDYIYPIEFSLSDFVDNSVNPITFSFDLSK